MSAIKLIPIYKEIIGDLETPVSAYLKLNRPNSFLLESVTGGEQMSRYSFIGFDPFCTFKSTVEKTEIVVDGIKQEETGNPIDLLETLVQSYQIDEHKTLPKFIAGAVGYFSWEIIQKIERIKLREKPKSPYPLAHFMLPSTMLIFDHVKRQIIIMVWAKESEVEQAKQKIESVERQLERPMSFSHVQINTNQSKDIYEAIKSNYEKNTFIDHVNKVKAHIYEGDIFQLVLSQKFSVPSHKIPFNVYRTLRYINPSPYMFYMDFDEYQIIGSSPEILVQMQDRNARVRPLAGTRPRRAENEEALIAELKADEKEIAEHIMLVDLGRNDLGRVCDYGTVKTKDVMSIEKYSHVMHMVSNVEGQLKKDKSAFDLFRATFPAGTLSGTPKIRAIELIDQYEPEERGPYGGALGYFDFRGNMDLCIIIRTILSMQNHYTIQAGAGLVADSVPETEYEESRNKAKAMVEACL